MKLNCIVFAVFLFCFCPVFSQADTTKTSSVQKDKNKQLLKSSLVPLALIGSGVFVNYSGGSLGKESLQEDIQDGLEDFHTELDNFLPFVPVITMYGADLLHVPARNDAFTQTKYLGIALLANNLVTLGLKQITDEERPNGDSYSFPSGHTSNAFVMATALHLEFKDTHTLLAYSGYVFATATGVLRVMNNEHWVSDVLAGAGIGMLCTQLVYHFEPLKNWQPFKKEGIKTSLGPSLVDDTVGMYAIVRF